MDEWQRQALTTFPELHSQINRTQDGIHGLWADLFSAVVAAYRATPVNEDFIRRVYEYAAWCVRQPQTSDAETDLSSAIAVGFLQNLPLDQHVFNDLHRWLSVETFEGCKTLFRYHLSEEEYSKLHDDFLRKKKDVAIWCLCLSKISKCLRGRELFSLCSSWLMLFPQPDHEGQTVGGPG